jgi:hypothetical protein
MEVPLIRYATILVAALVSTATLATAEAKPKHGHQRQNRLGYEVVVDANGSAVSRRPAGCPRAFCGCEASLYLFGRIRAELNLASNWIRKFPRTSPAPGTVAVRNHHVMVLVSQVDGTDWQVHDGNSGGSLTRDHVRSIRGYIIVDPRGG